MMDLPPDKMRTLRGYDLNKKWKLVCDQVRFHFIPIFTTHFLAYDACRNRSCRVPTKIGYVSGQKGLKEGSFFIKCVLIFYSILE